MASRSDIWPAGPRITGDTCVGRRLGRPSVLEGDQFAGAGDRRHRREQALEQAPTARPARLSEAFRRGNLFVLTDDAAGELVTGQPESTVTQFVLPGQIPIGRPSTAGDNGG
jgi:hypothetical protein